MTLVASNIADLSEVAGDGASPTPLTAPAAELMPAPAFTQPPPQPTFVDPAILSMGRRPPSGTPSASAPHHQSDGKAGLRVQSPRTTPAPPREDRRAARQPEQDLLDSIRGLTVDSPFRELSNNRPAGPHQSPLHKKKGRSQHARQAGGHAGDPGTHDTQGTPVANVLKAHGKGWRQTPILETNESFQPFNCLKRQGRRRRGLQDNGWASEDVTEEMGDFDFEKNLAKFDKRTIFDQMRKEDQVDDASRLVSHNHRAKPGTAGGKNLHSSENVLDRPSSGAQHNDFWNSEADVGVNEEVRLSGREARNGQGSRRADSKPGPSRKASHAAGGHPLSRVNSSVRFSQSGEEPAGRSSGRRAADGEQQQQQAEQPGLYLVPSNRRLETISTLQMLNLENIAANELGFSESLMAENAGRGVAEVAVTALKDPTVKVRFGLAVAGSSGDAALSGSLIVILAGNSKSGIRALAAGRHLRNKKMDVMVCLVGVEHERDLLEDLRRQMQLYRSFGGKVLSKNDFFEHLRRGSASGCPLTVSLIIDALLGLTISFEELRIGDQATVYELMEWANRNEAFVLSIDVPTGIDPTTGKVAVIDGSPLYVKPRYVVAIGAPKRGLLEAVGPASAGDAEVGRGDGGAAHEDEWRLFVADMGLGSAVWRKAGTKVRRGIDFDGKWVLEMRHRGGEVE